MNIDHSLCKEFLTEHPIAAARELEQLPVQHVAAMLDMMPDHINAVCTAMLPSKMSQCLLLMKQESAVQCLSKLPASAAAHIFRLLPEEQQTAFSEVLSNKVLRQIHKYMDFSLNSAGSILSTDIHMLPESLTVEEAVRYISRLHTELDQDIYIVDNKHKLLGMINPALLLTTEEHRHLREIMTKKIHSLSAHAMKPTLIANPGWQKHRQLPVVDRDNSLLGKIEYINLQQLDTENKTMSPDDSFDNVLSTVRLFWMSVANLLDSMFGIINDNKEHKK